MGTQQSQRKTPVAGFHQIYIPKADCTSTELDAKNLKPSLSLPPDFIDFLVAGTIEPLPTPGLLAELSPVPPQTFTPVRRNNSVTADTDRIAKSDDNGQNSDSTDTEAYSEDSDFEDGLRSSGSESEADMEANNIAVDCPQNATHNGSETGDISTATKEDDNVSELVSAAPGGSTPSEATKEKTLDSFTVVSTNEDCLSTDSDSDHFGGLLDVVGSGWKGPEPMGDVDDDVGTCDIDGEDDNQLSQVEILRARLRRCSLHMKTVEQQFTRRLSSMQMKLEHECDKHRKFKGAAQAAQEEMKLKFHRQKRRKEAAASAKYRLRLKKAKGKWKRAREDRALWHRQEVDRVKRRESALQLRVQILESQKVADQSRMQHLQQQVASLSKMLESKTDEQLLASQLVKVLSKHMPVQALAREICVNSRKASHELLHAAFENSECCVCMAAQRKAALQPCGHCVVCSQCAQKLCDLGSNCPVCRVKISGFLRVFT